MKTGDCRCRPKIQRGLSLLKRNMSSCCQGLLSIPIVITLLTIPIIIVDHELTAWLKLECLKCPYLRYFFSQTHIFPYVLSYGNRVFRAHPAALWSVKVSRSRFLPLSSSSWWLLRGFGTFVDFYGAYRILLGFSCDADESSAMSKVCVLQCLCM